MLGVWIIQLQVEDYNTLPDKSEPKDLDLTFIFVSEAN